MYIKFWVFFCKKKPKVYSARSQRSDGVESSYLNHILTRTCILRKTKIFVSPTTTTPSHHLLGGGQNSQKTRKFENYHFCSDSSEPPFLGCIFAVLSILSI